jgi:hypothetical protein
MLAYLRPDVVGPHPIVHIVVIQEERQRRIEPCPVLWMGQANQGLDSTLQVSNHEVCGTDQVQRLITVVSMIETVDP